jgi:Class II Aldolase and Adducin N-terminal domain
LDGSADELSSIVSRSVCIVLRLLLFRSCFIRGPSHGRHRNTQKPHDGGRVADPHRSRRLLSARRPVRLVGPDQYTRITARVPGPQNHFLINGFGMLYDEITASSLVKIDVDGNKVEPSDDEVNSGGFAIPSTIHMARPGINCVIHTHTVAGALCRCKRADSCPSISMRYR